MANSSFALGMVSSISTKLAAMKVERDKANRRTGRDLVVVKAAIVEEERAKLDLKLRTVRGARRMVSTTAFEAGSATGTALAINPGIGVAQAARNSRRG
jgi:hypothetical protein